MKTIAATTKRMTATHPSSHACPERERVRREPDLLGTVEDAEFDIAMFIRCCAYRGKWVRLVTESRDACSGPRSLASGGGNTATSVRVCDF